MNYRIESFDPYTITVIDNDDKMLRRGIFYMSPPGEFETLFSEHFHYTDAELEDLKRTMGW